MANNLTDEQINKIAEAIAAKIGKPAGPAILGCGSASSSQTYTCGESGGSYDCYRGYECGGAARFGCRWYFWCMDIFNCRSNFFNCDSTFQCRDSYNA